MKTTKTSEDINNRYTLALAERNCTLPRSEAYNTLTECARLILTELQNYDQRGRRNRYGFRLYAEKYHIVVLSDNEKN